MVPDPPEEYAVITPDLDLSRRWFVEHVTGHRNRPAHDPLRYLPVLVAALIVVSLAGAGVYTLSAPGPASPVAAPVVIQPAVVEVVSGAGPALRTSTGASPGAAQNTPTLVGATSTTVPWAAPLALTVSNGTFVQVLATDAGGTPLAGVIERHRLHEGDTDQGAGWRSTGTMLMPGMTYHLSATTVDAAGRSASHTLTATASRAAHYLHATISPSDHAVVGVGLPVIVTLDRRVDDPVARAAVLARLTVSSLPRVVGAWRWITGSELHYRAATYWASGTQLTATADLRRLALPDGTWGEESHTSTWSIGRSFVSTVDNTTHLMTSTVDGVAVRVMKTSLGRPGYDTHGGVHLVLEKQASIVMDSATTGHAVGDKDYYKETVLWTVRISYSGTFVHSAPWSVQDQGLRNVSHGCINLSPTDAEWFFGQALRGDIVEIVNTGVGPVRSDPGMSDWNYTFADWQRA